MRNPTPLPGRGYDAKRDAMVAALGSIDVPAGWKLVPIEPTVEMLRTVDSEAEDKYVARGRAYSAWASMVAAAPIHPPV